MSNIINVDAAAHWWVESVQDGLRAESRHVTSGLGSWNSLSSISI